MYYFYKFSDAITYYVIIYPALWIFKYLEYFFYIYIVPLYTGRPVALGWNPKFVKEELHGLWQPSSPIDIPYYEFMLLSKEELMEYGFEKTENGSLRRIAHPQMYYADPKAANEWGEMAWRCYLRDMAIIEKEELEKRTLDPNNTLVYYDRLSYNNKEFLSYNIQMDIRLFGYPLDIIEILLYIIFFLFCLVLYIVFYHLYKLHLRLENAEEYLNEHNLSLYPKKKERTAYYMQESWNEGTHTSDRFDLGIEFEHIFKEGTLITGELTIIMFISYIMYRIYSFLHYYVYTFYCVNMELFTYVFVYLFSFLSIYYWFKYKREEKEAIHRWVEIDYYYSHFLNHYFRTLAWLNLYKLVDDAPLFIYILIYTGVMIWIYFACDSCDYFMGWNQEYRIDIYERQTNMHFWWPRVLMNQTWHHFYVVLMKPWHFRIMYLFLYIILPFIAIYLFLLYYQNRIHVYLSNKFFFWNTRRYTIDEIKEQWQIDRKYIYLEEERIKNIKFGGLTIL